MLKNKHLTRALQACSDMGAWLLIIVVAIILGAFLLLTLPIQPIEEFLA